MRGRQGRQNVIRTQGGVIGAAASADNPFDCFMLFFTDEILDKIMEQTNHNIQLFLDKLSHDTLHKILFKRPSVRETNRTELTALFGLFLARGMQQHNYWDIQRLFSDLSHPIFQATMSVHRFKFLVRFLSFDDKTTRNERWQTDRFAACRTVFEMWNEQCGQQLQMNEYGAIDECLYSCRNQISFRQFNPSKPAKYGLLFKCINEVIYPYTHRSEVLLGNL